MIQIVGKSNISVKVIKDSISLDKKRMTTFELEYPRLIHSEFMTHRTISKNASSSRAVPLQKAIENINNNPAFPVHWGKAQNGMQANEELTGSNLNQAKLLWQRGIDQSIEIVNEFDKIGTHKQIAARWLETGQMIKVVASATDWDNFLYLRNDVDAQPEFKELARLIQEALDSSKPLVLFSGQWHTPYVNTESVAGALVYLDSNDQELTLEEAQKISASCTAQVSYRRLNETKEKAIEIYQKLFSGRKPHMSPTEHQATPIATTLSMNIPWDSLTWLQGVTHVDKKGLLHSGNLAGWVQLRQTLPNNVFEMSNCH